MFKTLEKIRQKPDSVKKQIAFFTALSFVGIIFGIWFSVVYPDLKQEKFQGDKVKNLEKSPTESLGETLGSGASSLGEEFNKIKDLFTSFSVSPTYYSATTTSKISSTTEESRL